MTSKTVMSHLTPIIKSNQLKVRNMKAPSKYFMKMTVNGVKKRKLNKGVKTSLKIFANAEFENSVVTIRLKNVSSY